VTTNKPRARSALNSTSLPPFDSCTTSSPSTSSSRSSSRLSLPLLPPLSTLLK